MNLNNNSVGGNRHPQKMEEIFGLNISNYKLIPENNWIKKKIKIIMEQNILMMQAQEVNEIEDDSDAHSIFSDESLVNKWMLKCKIMLKRFKI